MVDSEFYILLLLLLLCLFQVTLAPCFEVFFRDNVSTHPAVPQNVSHSRSSSRLEAQHVGYKILEICRQITVRILLPEHVSIYTVLTWQKFVSWVLQFWLLPRVVKDFRYEQGDSKGKDVSVLSLVRRLFVMYLRGHVHWSTKSGIRKTLFCSACKRDSEAKVNDFNFKILGYHYVLWFDITMCNSRLVKLVYGISNL